MFGQPKKNLMFNILEVLKQYTDENHRLSQKEIIDILRKQYDIKADRKSIKTNLMNLIDFGYDINYSTKVKTVKDKKTGKDMETEILSDFYLIRDFSDSELRYIIDGIICSTHLPAKQSKEIAKKIESLSSNYFRARVKHMTTLMNSGEEKTDNKQIFYNIDIIDEAIEKGKKIKFKYAKYDTDKRLKANKNDKGEYKEYIMSPYQMAACKGKYYLICNMDKFDDVANYRIDRIMDIEILDEKARKFSELKTSNGKRFDLNEYMKEHIFMYSGKSVQVKLRMGKSMISTMIDEFGKSGLKFSDEDEEKVSVRLKVNEKAIIQFAKNYAPWVMVESPKDIKEKVMEDLKYALDEYKKM